MAQIRPEAIRRPPLKLQIVFQNLLAKCNMVRQQGLRSSRSNQRLSRRSKSLMKAWDPLVMSLPNLRDRVLKAAAIPNNLRLLPAQKFAQNLLISIACPQQLPELKMSRLLRELKLSKAPLCQLMVWKSFWMKPWKGSRLLCKDLINGSCAQQAAEAVGVAEEKGEVAATATRWWRFRILVMNSMWTRARNHHHPRPSDPEPRPKERQPTQRRKQQRRLRRPSQQAESGNLLRFLLMVVMAQATPGVRKLRTT